LENIGPERAGSGVPGKAGVGSHAAKTLENNGDFCTHDRAENELCREVGGGNGTGVEHSLRPKVLIFKERRFGGAQRRFHADGASIDAAKGFVTMSGKKPGSWARSGMCYPLAAHGDATMPPLEDSPS
jgi:hypothetical protein